MFLPQLDQKSFRMFLMGGNYGADFSSQWEREKKMLGQHQDEPVGRLQLPVDLTQSWLPEFLRNQLDSLQLFAIALHNTTDAVMITTSHLQHPGPEVIYVNRAFTQITGYFPEEILGKNPRILQGSKTDSQLLKRLKQELSQGRIFQGEVINYRKDSTEFNCQLYIEPIRNNQNKITHYLAIQRDITPEFAPEFNLISQEKIDSLTGLPNRSFLLQKLQDALDTAQKHHDYLFAVLFIDLDRFKLINESWGHQVGDQLIVTMSKRLQNCLRPTDIVTHLGGDEFAIVLNQISSLETVSQVAKRIQNQLRKPMILLGHEVCTTASIGITLSSNGYDSPDDLLRDADTALHRAKIQGRACYAVFEKTMHRHVLEQFHLENDLRRAIEMDQFLLYYQPIVSFQTGRIAGFEALLRWQHPERGMVWPSRFIPVAEETGLIQTIGEWVLQEACTQMKAWQLAFPQSPPLFMSVNLSSQQLAQTNLVEKINHILRQTECNPSWLKLEITESALIDKAETAVSTLGQLRELGIHLCIDDFGTGYSSLSRLYYFPINTLKVDRSFVAGINSSNDQAKIAEAIVRLAHNLSMEVIAEGVETQEQFATMRSWGCELAQGYWLSKPTDRQKSEALLSSQPSW